MPEWTEAAAGSERHLGSKRDKPHWNHRNERLLVADHGGLHAYPHDNDIVLDHTVYAFNAMALSVFVSLGAGRIALPPEMDIAQKAQMMTAYKAHNKQTAPVEALLYARHELMAMRHCVLSGALGKDACGLCKKKRFYLEDMKGHRYPLVTDSRCQSHVMHSRVTEANPADYFALGVKHYRVELFDEDAKQSRDIVKRFAEQLKGMR